MLFAFLLLIAYSTNSYSQVRVPFTPRASDLTPTQTLYNIKGDFTMIGNTNLTLVNYDETSTNNADMKYVDFDVDAVPGNNTFNSSSATLTFSNENGAIPECSNILFAGLYWVGRADTDSDSNNDGDNNPNTFQVTKGGITKNFDKQKLLIKGPGSSGYTELIADPSDIYYPSNIDRNIFTAYKEVTQYVRDNGLGEYFVADIALSEGNQDVTGFSGGWGMVIVYENSKMKWRDVTVFDGHAYLEGPAGDEFDIAINGFNAAQTGDVNLKLGLMASEGELNWVNDYFEIEILETGNYQRLANNRGATNNFFDSSIITGGNARTPNLVNNTGLDIVMFDVPNPGNSIIGNSQTNTSFRYGSSQDTFVIFNATFSVDAYIPEPEGILTNTSINGNPPSNTNTSLEPSENADYAIEIKNTGTEETNNTTITVPLPGSVNPNNLNIDYHLYPPLTSTTNPNTPTFDPNIGTNGAIVWNLGTLPIPTDPDIILADISFTLTVTTDCSILTDPNFDPNVAVNGTISGVGATSSLPFNFDLIQGYETTGPCIGNPIPGPSLITIDYLDYVNEAPTASNPADINVQCIGDVPAFDIEVITDEADNQGTPVVAFVSDVSDNNTCPETITRTYSITDICNNQILVTQNIIVNDTTVPTATGTIAPSTVEGCTAADVTAPVNTVAALEALGLAIADNCTDDANLIVTSADTASGTCPVVITRTYTITDACNNFVTASQTINVNDTTAPTASNPATITVPGGPAPASDVSVVIDELDNCTANPIVTFVSDVSDNGTCPETITRTYNVADDCGNSINVTQTILITDPILPTASNPADINVQCIGDVPAFDIEVITDEADNQGTPVVAFVSDVSDNNTCPETITRTYSITDICNNQILVTQNIIVNDTTVPTATGTIAPSTVEGCTAADATAPVNTVAALEALGLAIADNCTDDANLIVTSADTASGTCPVVITRTYTITDACNNFVTASQTINVNDTTAPTASNPATITVPGGPAPASDVSVVIDELDNCTANPIVTFVSDVSDNGTCPETITRTYNVADDCGNSINVTQTILITDPILPTASNPADINVQCIGDVPAFDIEVITDEADNQGTPVVAFVSDVSDNNTCPETITRTYSITDICNNQILVTQNIIVNDTTVPTATGTIAPSTVEGCTAADVTAPVNTVAALEALGLAIADNCTDDANLIVTSADTASGTCPVVITRTYTITDACNNFVTASQTINVNDTTAPTASNPATITVPGGPAPASDVSVVIDELDNCTANPIVTFVSDVSDNGTCPETITRTYNVADDCGNSINVTQTILITDPILPTASNPADINVQCIGDVPAFDIEVITDEADNQGTPVVAFVSDVSDNNTCPETITRTYSITDICNNQILVTQNIIVNDTTVPTATGTIAPSTVEGCTAADATAPVNTVAALEALGLAIADNCTDDANLIVTSADTASGTCPVVITRTYTITDACNNFVTASQTINVNDTTAPTASNPATITVPGGPAPASDVSVVIDELDNCTANPIVTFVSDVSDNGTCPETITRTYNVADDCGNSINVTQTILITDPILPTASNPADINVQCIGDVPAFDIEVITDEADNQGTPVVAFVSDVSDNNTCPETITRTYSITDICNNQILVTQNIIVNDTTVPTATGTIAPSTVEGCTAADATAPVNTVAALEALGLAIADNCTDDANLIVTSADTASGTCPVVITRTYTITDACNNFVTASQTINVNDTTAPTASNPATITVPGGPAPASDVSVVIDELDNCTANPNCYFCVGCIG